MNFITYLPLLIVTLFFSSFGFSGEIKNLYEAKIIIADESEKENRNELLNKVFHKVLLKVTGSNNYLKIADADKLIANAQHLVQKYAFQSTPLPEPKGKQELGNVTTSNKIKGHQQEPPSQSNFWARFNKYATDALLQEHKLTVWGNLRPETLIWLSIENPPLPKINQLAAKKIRRELITTSNYPSIINLLNQSATQRGIALLFPFGDLQDKNKLSMNDLWGNYSRTISAASVRYQSQAILAVRIYKEPSGLWIAKWSLYVLDKIQNWQTKHESLNVILNNGIYSLADRLAVLFAIQANTLEDKSTIIQIHNITNFQSYLRVNTYFKRITAIQSAHLIRVKGDSISYRIHYIGDEQHLIQNLVLGEVLQKIDNNHDINTEGSDDGKQTDYVPVIISNNNAGEQKGNDKQSIKSETPPPSPDIEPINIPSPSSEIIADSEFWLAQ